MPALQVLKYISEALVRWSEGFKSPNPNSSVSEMLNFYFYFIGKIKSDSFQIGSTALIDYSEYLAQNDYGKTFC